MGRTQAKARLRGPTDAASVIRNSMMHGKTLYREVADNTFVKVDNDQIITLNTDDQQNKFVTTLPKDAVVLPPATDVSVAPTQESVDAWKAYVDDPNISQAQKVANIHALEKVVKAQNPRLTAIQKTHQTSLDHMEAWTRTHAGKYQIQANECSRLHILLDHAANGFRTNSDGSKLKDDDLSQWWKKDVQTFVVKHDWAKLMSDHEDDMESADFMLPYPNSVFEFKISGKVFVVVLMDPDCRGLESLKEAIYFAQAPDDVWVAFDEHTPAVTEYLVSQIKAMCAVLEAEVVESEVVRAPHKLNEKRIKQGKVVLKDYHIVDLSKRKRKVSRNPNPTPTPTGRKVRLHFRRGHWAHYTNHKTWRGWTLVGNPDLGFVNKEYKL